MGMGHWPPVLRGYAPRSRFGRLTHVVWLAVGGTGELAGRSRPKSKTANAFLMLDIFIPTYPEDVQQLRMLLRSLDTFLDLDAVSSLSIAHVGSSDGFGRIRDVDTLKFASRTQFLSSGDLELGEPDGSRRQGWNLQQVAKLNFSRHARQAFYMVLDSKNLALRPLGLADLVVDGRAACTLEDADNHIPWWRGAAWALAHPAFDFRPGVQALSAATPVLMHTESVQAMVAWLERRHRMSLAGFFLKRRPIRSQFMRITEFSLYHTYMDREHLFETLHFPSDRLHDVRSQIWTGHTADERRARVARIVNGVSHQLFTGIQRGAWVVLAPDEQAALDAMSSGLPRVADET